MPSCLHLLNTYLPLTETFIWQYLSQAREFQPLILAEKLENKTNFPLPKAAFLVSHPTRSPLAALGARLLNRFAQADYRSCVSEVQALKPSLIHIHNGYRACVALDFIEQIRLPYAVNFYGSDVTQKEFLRRARPGYLHLFKDGKAFLVEGPSMRKKLITLGCPENRIRLQRIAIDASSYAFRERTWDGNRPVRFLFVGRLVEKKGLQWGLRALAQCKSAFPWELDIIGGGPLLPALEAQIKSLDILDRVRFLGYLPLPAMRGKLEDHDVLFQPSCTSSNGDGEGGAPTVLLEAQACGMPIISTMHDDIPYVTLPDGSALLAPERDVETMANLIKKLVARADSWPEMGRVGRKHVEDKHDARKEVIGLESVYHDIVGV